MLEVVDGQGSREITELLSDSDDRNRLGAALRFAGAGSARRPAACTRRSPRFAERYAEIGTLATDALRAFADDVRSGNLLDRLTA